MKMALLVKAMYGISTVLIRIPEVENTTTKFTGVHKKFTEGPQPAEVILEERLMRQVPTPDLILHCRATVTMYPLTQNRSVQYNCGIELETHI